MKRRVSLHKFHHKWKRRLFVLLSLSFCCTSLVLLDTQYSRIKMFALLSPPFVQKPKIAFLFVAWNRFPLDMVWDAFFQGDKENRFSIFVHFKPGFLFNKATTRSSYFLNRQVNDNIQVDWGEANMIQAERILLKHALLDSFNERFVFLSDSFADTKEGRYFPKMHVIPVHNWRKGSRGGFLPENMQRL